MKCCLNTIPIVELINYVWRSRSVDSRPVNYSSPLALRVCRNLQGLGSYPCLCLLGMFGRLALAVSPIEYL